jgi:hypothetical protein
MPILGHGSAGFLADDDGVLSPTASSARELRQSKQNQIPENPTNSWKYSRGVS